MKIISFLIFMVLMTTALPLTNAINEINTEGVINQNDSIAKRRVFTTCYIEASGPVNHMWKTFWLRPFGGDIAFVSYWAISFREPDVQVTIYNRENGRVLWQSENDFGQWGLKLVGYFGMYTNPPVDVDEDLEISLRGKAMVAITITE